MRILLVVFWGIVFGPQIGQAEEKLPVFVSIVPQRTFVQQIGKDRVDVQVMVQPGASPHTYEPKPRQMAAVSRSKLYFAVGVAFEKAWLGRIAAVNPDMKVVHTDQGIEKIPMAARPSNDDAGEHRPEKDARHLERERHRGEEDSHHEHDGLDPHIWLSPPLVKLQARTIRDALQEIDPSHRRDYEANYRRFVSQVDALHAELLAIFAGKQGLQFLVFHPAWGYFAHAYGLEQVPVQIEGKDPKPAQLKALIDDAREKKIRVIFVQPQFSAKSAALVAREIGGEVVFADPLAADWFANLRQVANRFKAELR